MIQKASRLVVHWVDKMVSLRVEVKVCEKVESLEGTMEKMMAEMMAATTGKMRVGQSARQ